ncbi:signal recognition particle-docking protein FtsY [Spirochaeta thermophila DSM 6578]|uniref:Signal recognition particle receptor FtsY n=1 Tax=Winmispira thermophila (strain ATCC 700085 / DSM 6578 / Z-1203) TaxID=869211 RepID=G0GFD4_WINT7|nr:signal recognition particle-docking protein FtsY [Spirochaeta thermophila]AEJ61548.1 signal recognition particle-docking protein FtsY [Spirochaeta thermophila DSM 6578]
MAWLMDRLRSLWGGARFDEAFWEEFEDLLIEADLGAETAFEVVEEVQRRVKKEGVVDVEGVREVIKDVLRRYVRAGGFSLPDSGTVVLLFVGVNGVGKTTTIAKCAHFIRSTWGRDDVVLAAGDTFRAGAIDQLRVWGERLGVRVVAQQPGADPAAVIFDAIQSVERRGGGVVLADTAGRFHNRASLMDELAKVDRVIRTKAVHADYRRLLVIDASTGQNAFRQAEVFQETVGLDGLVLAKYDGAAKGGVLVPISRRLEIPALFVGTGEGLEDLRPFDVEEYLSRLVEG